MTVEHDLPKVPPDAIVVLESSARSTDPSEIVASNAAVVEALLAEHLTIDEISPHARQSYFIDKYRAEVNNGGFSQFVYNVDWRPGVVRTLLGGLQAIGAREHLGVFLRGVKEVQALGPERLRTFLAGDYFGENAERDALNAVNDEFRAVEATENLTALNAAWLRAHPELRTLPSHEAIAALIRQRGEALPDRLQRIADAHERAPRFEKLIRHLCELAGQRFERITAGNPSHVHEGRPTVAWHFLTDAGHFYFVEDQGRALMLEAGTDRVVCQIATDAMPRPTPITLPEGSYATNPGRVTPSVWTWTRHYPKWPLLYLSGVLASPFAAWLGIRYLELPTWAWVLPLIAVAQLVRYWINVRERFQHGDACPAIVVGLAPTRIAVYADLSRSLQQSHRAIRVLDTPLRRIGGRKAEIGMRLPTVALFRSGADPARYATVLPWPVDCATTDRATLERVMQTFPEHVWREFEQALAQLPQPDSVGLYWLDAQPAGAAPRPG